MEAIFDAVDGVILALAASATIVGIMLNDFRKINLEKDFLHHPYAKRFRRRPLISIIIQNEPSEKGMDSIRHRKYRKVEITFAASSARGEYLLPLVSDIALKWDAVNEAVRQLNCNQRLNAVEIVARPDPPHTLSQLFHFYHDIVVAPFVSARAGLGIILPCSSWPIIIRAKTNIKNWRTRSYIVVRWLVRLANLAALLYVGYIAIWLHQPVFLLAYLCAFAIWMMMAIWIFPHLSVGQKLLYLILAPVSVFYFMYLAVKAPFTLGYKRINLEDSRPI